MRPALLLALILLSSALLADSRAINGHRRGRGHHKRSRPAIPQLPAVPAIPTVSPLADFCAKTDYPDLCLSTATPFAAAFPHIDDMAMLNMLISALTEKTNAAATNLNRLATDPATPPLVARNLVDCRGSFTDALDDITSAKTAVAGNNSWSALSKLSGVISDLETCNDSYQESPTATPNPVAGDIQTLENMAGNCLYFVYKAFNVPQLPS